MTPSSPDTSETIGLKLTDQELIDFIGREASQKAIEMARARLSWLIGVVGLIATLITGSTAAFLTNIVDGQIDTALEPIKADLTRSQDRLLVVVEEKFDGFSERLTTVMDAKFTNIDDALSTQLKTEISDAVKLTLTVAESFSISQGYAPQNADLMLRTLTQLSEAIETFDSDSTDLVFRRVENMIDVFVNAADYPRAFEAYAIFGDRLPLHSGIYMSMIGATTSAIFVDPDNLAKVSHVSRRLLAKQFDPRSVEIEFQKLLMMVSRATERDWDKETLFRDLQNEVGRQAVFADVVRRFLKDIEAEIQPGELHHSPAALDRFDVLQDGLKLTGLADRDL